MGSLQAAGISHKAARTICSAKRKSTRTVYDSKSQKFSAWCKGKEINPLHPSTPQVLDYLEHLASIPLGHNTILTHLSALTSCSSLLEGYTDGSHPLVSAWVKGHRAEFPPKKIMVPPWNLSSVLVALTKGDFEHLTEAIMEYATYKVLFLVPLSSAKRIFEVPTLCIDPPFFLERAHFF